MGALTVVEFTTLDGVVQGFHGADERDGFGHSGWGDGYQDPAQFDAAVEHLPATGAYLFGRRTYDELSQFWPFQPDANPMAKHLNRSPKHVVTHRDDALEWSNARRLDGDLVPGVQALKSSTDGNVHPLVLGAGHTLFPRHDMLRRLELQSVDRTATGVVSLTYLVAH